MKPGEKWFFQTVSHYILGEIESINENEILLKAGTASWVAITGRFHNFMTVGVLKESEIEPFGDVPVIIKQQSLVIATPWKHELPKYQQ